MEFISGFRSRVRVSARPAGAAGRRAGAALAPEPSPRAHAMSPWTNALAGAIRDCAVTVQTSAHFSHILTPHLSDETVSFFNSLTLRYIFRRKILPFPDALIPYVDTDLHVLLG